MAEELRSSVDEIEELRKELARAHARIDELSARAQAPDAGQARPSVSADSSQGQPAPSSYYGGQAAAANYWQQDPRNQAPTGPEAPEHASPQMPGGAYPNYAQPGWQQQAAPDASGWQHSGYASQPPYVQQQTTSLSQKDHVAAGLLAIFFGWLGIHKFYLGYSMPGFIMLAVSLIGSLLTFGLASLVMGIIGVIEGILYLTRSPEEFTHDYVLTRREWF